jgi:DNA topoisomerase-2
MVRIKDLHINVLDPLKIPNFLVAFVTPIVRVGCMDVSCGGALADPLAQVTKGKQRINLNFFTIPEYEQWLEQTPDAHKWDTRSCNAVAPPRSKLKKNVVDSRHMEKHMIPFGSTQDGEREVIDLAFSKKKADDRKEWLQQFRVRAHIRAMCVYSSRVAARHLPR